MGHGASGEELERYRGQGFLVRYGVLEEALLVRLRAAVDDIHCRINAEADRGGVETERVDGRRYQRLLESTVKWEWGERSRDIRSMEPCHHLHPELDELIDDPRLCDLALDLVGEASVGLFSDKLNFKRPGGAPFPWHQDNPYWAFDCAHLDRLTSVQIYLDEATVENGCLWVIPGSHRDGSVPGHQDRGVMGRLYTDLERFEGEAPVPLTAPGGSIVFFHGDLIHGSQTNRSAECRRALVFTYQPAGLPRWNLEDVRIPLMERG